MNNYLEIARKVLIETRQSLSAKQILRIAYELQIVPHGLYGKTQHKTLHARLAEDILLHRKRSQFARTAAGRFCLRTHLSEVSKRGEYFAKLRADQLRNYEVPSIERSALRIDLSSPQFLLNFWPPQDIKNRTLSKIYGDRNYLYFRIFIVIVKSDQLLIHDGTVAFGDEIDGRITLGVIGVLKCEDQHLFSSEDFGIRSAAIRTIVEQLYLDARGAESLIPRDFGNVVCVHNPESAFSDQVIAAISIFDCPENSPADIQLSELDEAHWSSLEFTTNTPELLDPWSKLIAEDNHLQQLISA